MMSRRGERGFSVIEMMISMTITLLALGGIAGLVIQNSRVNKAQQMAAEVQSNARICLSMIVQRLRSAGWDPLNAGMTLVNLDPDPSDDVSEIEIFADLDEDGATKSLDEQVTIRHSKDRIEWRRTGDTSSPFLILGVNISNDADGDGTPEPMFEPDSTTDPTRITVRITAQSPVVDLSTGDFIRYTVSSDVVLRKRL